METLMEFRKPEAYQPMMILSALWTLQQVYFSEVSKIMKRIEKHKFTCYVIHNIPLLFLYSSFVVITRSYSMQ